MYSFIINSFQQNTPLEVFNIMLPTYITSKFIFAATPELLSCNDCIFSAIDPTVAPAIYPFKQ